LPIVSTCQVDDQKLPEVGKDKSFILGKSQKTISTFWPIDFIANIIIRVWYLEDSGSKGELVGYVYLDDMVMSASSRGTRTYPVVFLGDENRSSQCVQSEKGRGSQDEFETNNDIFDGIRSALIERKRKDRTLGPVPSILKTTISLKLYSTHSNKTSGEPDKWRLELLRAHGLPKAPKMPTSSDVQDGVRDTKKVPVHKPLCSVVCEVLWRGPANFVHTKGIPLKKIVEEDEHEVEESLVVNDKVKQVVLAVSDKDKQVIPDPTEKAIHTSVDEMGGPVNSKHKVKTKTTTTTIDAWVSLGCTAEKSIPNSSAEDPRFGAKDAGNFSGVFDLPPVWISIGSGSPVSEKDSTKSPGDWRPRNYLTRPHANAKKNKDGGGAKLRFSIVAHSVICFLRLQKIAHQNPDMSIVRRRMDVFRLLGHAEEEERRCMAREELNTRVHDISTEEEKYRLLADQQVIIAGKFSAVMNLIQCPTRTLSRLRFYMGGTLEGGGMRIMCQDPVHSSDSSRSIVELFIMPLMYPEDEEEMRRHVEGIAVVSRSNPVVMPVVEMSVHALKGFTSMGFVGFETRTAFTLVERNETKPTLCEYLRGLKDISDKNFHSIIVQILEGLAALHDEGIIHRNFHKDCVFIQKKTTDNILPNRFSEPVSERSSIILPYNESNTALLFNHDHDIDQDIVPECCIGDYWFLRSPRSPGCVYSQGRADWGDKSTAPPEVRGGFKISAVSDIYAFGLCVLQWSKCVNLPIDINLDKNTDSSHIAKKVNVKNIANDIMLGFGTTDTKLLPPNDPIKCLGSLANSRWGSNSWLQKMSRMMLQENPRHRATAKDILQFLKSVTFEDE